MLSSCLEDTGVQLIEGERSLGHLDEWMLYRRMYCGLQDYCVIAVFCSELM